MLRHIFLLTFLQRGLAPGTTELILLESTLQVPLTVDTQKYCWTHPYLGLLVHTAAHTPTDINTENNVRFYRVIFDCGGQYNSASFGVFGSSCVGGLGYI